MLFIATPRALDGTWHVDLSHLKFPAEIQLFLGFLCQGGYSWWPWQLLLDVESQEHKLVRPLSLSSIDVDRPECLSLWSLWMSAADSELLLTFSRFLFLSAALKDFWFPDSAILHCHLAHEGGVIGMLYDGVLPMSQIAVLALQLEQEGAEHIALGDFGVQHQYGPSLPITKCLRRFFFFKMKTRAFQAASWVWLFWTA